MDGDLFETWFRIADEDRDNAIAGAEAVKFFQRSNLSQETLFKIWNLIAGDKPALTRPQFFSSMRLISLAQRSGGILEDGPARSTLIGMGPALPPPTMAGLEVPKAVVSQQSWQSVPQVPGAAASSFSAAAPAAPPPRPTGAFPPLQPQDLQNFRNMFAQLDSNRDGYVTGGECYEAFLAWNLPKSVLKDVWAAVAGDNGELSQQQFIACLYLMDLARKGIPPPAQIPPGPFPPLATPAPAAAAPSPAFSLSQHDVFSRDLPMPDIPGRVTFTAAPAPPLRSGGPALDANTLSGLDPLEKQRLQNDQQQAKEMEEKLHTATNAGEAAQAREATYQKALQELTLWRSRTSAALLQAQERCERETAEADAMQAQYEQAWGGADSQHSRGRRLLDELTKAKGRKVEVQTKLAELQKDIAQLAQLSDTDVAAEEEATAKLHEEVAAAQARKAQLEMGAEAMREARRTLEAELEALELTCAAAEADVAASQKDLDALQEKIKSGEHEGVELLQRLLKNSASVYRSLLEHAEAAKIEIPADARLAAPTAGGALPPLKWDEYAAAHAADWDDFLDEGFKVVNAIPAEAQYMSPSSSMASMSAATSPSPVRGAASLTALGQSAGFAGDFGDTGTSGLAGPNMSSGSVSSTGGGFGGPPAEAVKAPESWAAF